MEVMMAQMSLCPQKPGRIHIEVDGRTVCLGSRDSVLGAIRNAVNMGLLGRQDVRALQAQVAQQLTLPATEAEALDGTTCGLSHSFVRSPLEALDAMCGTGNPHPDDVN